MRFEGRVALHRLPDAACEVAKHIQGEATVRPP